MKICHVSSVHTSYDTRILYKECSSLAKEYDVILLAKSDRQEIINQVRIEPIIKFKNRFIRIFLSPILIFFKALQVKADIYHLHDHELIPLIVVFKIFTDAKIIYDVHEHFNGLMMLKKYLNPFIRNLIIKFNYIFEKVFFPQFDFIITATPFIKAEIKKNNPRCESINNFPILSEFNLVDNWGFKKNEICYIGNITKDRGIDKIISALKDINVVLNLAGNYYPENFREELVQIPSWEKVHEYGFVDRITVANIFIKSLAGLIILQPYENYINSYPNKLFEYMAAGIPIIGSNFKLWKEFVQKNNCGILVNPDDELEVSSAIKYILENKQEAKKMGQNGRIAIKKHYNWIHEEIKLLRIYKELCE